MNSAEMFQAALETTDIIKERKYSLFTFGITKLPYFFVGRSEFDPHDTVIREGRVVVEKPHIIVPGNNPMFEGFEFDEDMPVDEGDIKYILMSRRIQLPSLRYINSEQSMDVENIAVDEKVSQLCNRLDSGSDTITAVIRGESRFFPLPLIIYVGKMILRSTGDNLTELFEKSGGLGL